MKKFVPIKYDKQYISHIGYCRVCINTCGVVSLGHCLVIFRANLKKGYPSINTFNLKQIDSLSYWHIEDSG